MSTERTHPTPLRLRRALAVTVLAAAALTGITALPAPSAGAQEATAVRRSGTDVVMQTLPEAFEWVWKGYKASGH